MSKVIENEQELNTSNEELTTKNYLLEILGLKNPTDLRKFSRSFMKIDKTMKDIENNSNKIATSTQLGKVKIGNTLIITDDGLLNVLATTPETLIALVEKYKGAGA